MKISPRQQSSFIQSPPTGVVGAIIYGPNAPQIDELVKTMALKTVDDLSDPFHVAALTPSDVTQNPTVIADEMAAQSLMGGARVVIIRSANDKITTALKDALAVMENTNTPNRLIIAAGNLTPRSSLRKLGESSKTMGIIACYEDDERSLSDFIRSQFSVLNLNPDRDVAPYLAHQCSGNRTLAIQAVNKIHIYIGDRDAVTLDDARECVNAPSETSLDAAVDGVLDGNLGNLDEALHILWGENMSPIAVIRALQGRLYRLRELHAAINGGMPMDTAMKSLRPPVFFKAKPSYARHLKQWSLHKIDRALSALLRLEVQCKQTGTPDQILTHRVLAEMT